MISSAANPDALPNGRGTYALLLYLPRATHLKIGKLGAFDFPRGYYVYVGSARGAGGLRARVMRHWHETKKLKWHIDYLRAFAKPLRVWYSMDAQDEECAWADAFACHAQAKIIAPHFGASDCGCAAHLWFFPRRPRFRPPRVWHNPATQIQPNFDLACIQ